MTTQELTQTITTPYEDLRIWAYRILGEEFKYYYTGRRVRPFRQMSTWKRIFCLMFPMSVITLGIITLMIPHAVLLSQYGNNIIEALLNAPLWTHLLGLAWLSLMAYSYVGGMDMLRALQLISLSPSKPAITTDQY